MSYNRARQGIAGGAAGGGGGGGGDAAYVALNTPVTYPPQRHYGIIQSPAAGTSLNTLNEGLAFIGQVWLAGGPGSGPKTISSAGGKIHWRVGPSLTFADAGTSITIGIQDLNVDGEPDDTFDVSDTLVGGTDTLTANATEATAMTTGSKSLDHGDIIAVTFDMTARAGSDSVVVWYDSMIGGDISPAFGGVMTTDGSTWSNGGGNTTVLLEFDDGTYGVLTGGFPASFTSSIAFDQANDPDEYGNLINPPFACKLVGASARLNYVATGVFSLCLYSNPLGATPTLIEAKAFDADMLLNTTSYAELYFDAEHELLPGTEYAITIRPTTTSDMTLYHYDLMVAGAGVFIGLDNTKYYAVERTDNAGAFTDFNGGTAKTRQFHLNPLLSAIKAAQT